MPLKVRCLEKILPAHSHLLLAKEILRIIVMRDDGNLVV
jgi:hypothetical protein